MNINRSFRNVLLLTLITVCFAGSALGRECQQEVLNFPPQTLLDAHFSPDGKNIARIFAGGTLEIIDSLTTDILLEYQITLNYHLTKAKLNWSPTGHQIAAGIGNDLFVLDLNSLAVTNQVAVGANAELTYFEDGSYVPEGVVSLQWSSDGQSIMTQTVSSRYSIWSIEQNKFLFELTLGNNPIPVVWMEDAQIFSNGQYYLDLRKERFVSYTSTILPSYHDYCSSFFSTIELNDDKTLLVQGTINGCVVIVDATNGEQRVVR
jgi:WD40 repeat protein